MTENIKKELVCDCKTDPMWDMRTDCPRCDDHNYALYKGGGGAVHPYSVKYTINKKVIFKKNNSNFNKK